MDNKRDGGMVGFAVDHPKTVTWVMLLSTLVLVALAALPTLWPDSAKFLNAVKIDADPENMLPADAPVRVFHNASKQQFALYDIVVVGIVNETHPDGVFNVESLRRISELTEFARTLNWPDPKDPGRRVGVVEADIMAPSTVDNIEQAGLGAVSFDWLMPAPPGTRAAALSVRDRARKIPLLDGTLVSEDGKAISLYLPLTSKDLSYRVRKALLGKVKGWGKIDDAVYITGLPVAEDTFGVEMFIQMAISAPLAMLVIFLVMWAFFRNIRLILAPMIVAMVAAASTMALLVVTGNTIHIMSSMIPIFIMPIAVLDAVHILSEFYDRYPRIRDRRRTVIEVMGHLFKPMLFTTLTTAVGFSSLALTPIPPVQVFGVFVSLGVLLAWFWTIVFVPAFIIFIPEEKLTSFGHGVTEEEQNSETAMSRWLMRLGGVMYRRARLVLLLTLAVVVLAAYGISRININDNPVKWFQASHPIRIADRILNEHFGGTYMAYLSLQAPPGGEALAGYIDGFVQRLDGQRQRLSDEGIAQATVVFDDLRKIVAEQTSRAKTKAALLSVVASIAEGRARKASEEQFAAWDEASLFLDKERQRDEVFKQPRVLRYISALQEQLRATGVVGKSNSLTDIVKTVYRELLLGKAEQFRVPDTANAVAQTLLTYQGGYRPDDLWHFVTPDYRATSIWVQMNSGDNQDMSRVVQVIDDFIAANPPPMQLQARWFGPTYINVIWQSEMVSGMLKALLGSFLVVLIMMSLLFRSLLWGVLCMVPLSVTVGLIYGLVGLIGKDYDMPIAVLSALSLGLAVDYAIHFLSRAREAYQREGDWQQALATVFGEPARAITRNALVLGVGFLPLLAAPLLPYKTVGVFIAAILVTAGLGTLLILPALITVLQRWLFTDPRPGEDAGSAGGTLSGTVTGE